MLKILEKIYYREMFLPSFLGVFTNPYYIIRRGLYKGIISKSHYLHGRLLDFGCGRKPYKDIIRPDDYIGLDIIESGHLHTNENIDVYYDGKTLPFAHDQFDSVFSSEVFEHIFNIDDILLELNRVIKPGGYMLITVPFVWFEHETPYDFARYTSFGIEHLLTKHGFEIIEIEKTTNYIETIFQMWNAYLFHFLFPPSKILKILMVPLLIAPITILSIFISKLLPKNKDLFHNSIVIARKPR